MDHKLISNVVLQDVCHSDYPDYVDAYIESADYNGLPMTDQEIDLLNEDSEFIHQMIIDQY